MASKYSLYKVNQTNDNLDIINNYRFTYQNIDYAWIYTNKKIDIIGAEKIKVENSNLSKELTQWIIENNIQITKEKLLRAKKNEKNKHAQVEKNLNELLDIIENQLNLSQAEKDNING